MHGVEMKLLSVTSEAAQSQGWWDVKATVSNVQTEGRFTYRSSGEAGDGPASGERARAARCKRKWGPTARCSKASQKARLVEKLALF